MSIKTEIKIKIKLEKGKELNLNLDEAKMLFEELGKVFEKEKVYVPWYQPYIKYGEYSIPPVWTIISTPNSITVSTSDTTSSSEYIIDCKSN